MVYDNFCWDVQQQSVVKAESRVEEDMTLHLIEATKSFKVAIARLALDKIEIHFQHLQSRSIVEIPSQCTDRISAVMALSGLPGLHDMLYNPVTVVVGSEVISNHDI